ncbi:MAG TPA: chromosome segregation protein SMC [Candidatus Udaeobacter sp.]|nr:chromosome segregation protein SMC [Candidatus Udaeobacter sp.]
MHLQSLELFGFKSFADKTAFNFHEGVTAIVGPNGCGKSNVLDAVRWALGEQSAKSLRGEEMADVIFNGAETRKPVGFAEVSLTFTDCGEELGIEWHDVRVTRRVYRDGNSEYLLNKTPCRLRDIQSLFADTGIARTAYSMMEQGRIDMILSSRPEDRRAVFEEAAGITKYKTQKREALRKLEATEANLLRISDVIKEVKRQIGSLQRQAGKARRYQALHADLRVLETHYARHDLDVLEHDFSACREDIHRLTESEHSTHKTIDEDESTLGNERHSLDKLDVQIADSRAETQRLDSEIANHRNRIEFNKQRAEELDGLIRRARRDVAEAETKRKKHATEIEQTNNSIAKIEVELNKRETELSELSILAEEMRKDRTERGMRLQTLQIALSKSESRISALNEELSGIEMRRELTVAQIKQLGREIKISSEARQKLVAQVATSLTVDPRQTADLETSLRERETLLSEAEQRLTVLERTLAEKQSRLDVLRQLNQEGEGLAEGSQAVLKGADGLAKIREAVAGSLVAQLDVDPQFIQAIEAALGRNLHTIILKESKVASEIVEKLKKNKLGQAALLIPHLATPPKKTAERLLPKGALAWAGDKLRAPQAFESLVRQLLDNVAVFPDLEQALEWKQHDPALAMATLAGEYISAEGIVFGGSTELRATSLLERKAEITELGKEEAALTKEHDLMRIKRDGAKTAVEIATRLRREVSEAERKIDKLESEKTALERQIAASDERVAHLERELQSVADQLARQNGELGAFEATQKQTTCREQELTEEINQMRLAIATARQRHESLNAQREPMNARDIELRELIALRDADIAMYEQKLAVHAQETRESEALIKTQTVQRNEVETNSAKIAGQRATLLATICDREKELRRLRHSLGELQDRRAQRQVRESQLQMKIDNLVAHISRSYQIDLREFASDQSALEKVLRVQLKKWTNRSLSDEIDNGEGAANLPSRSENAMHANDTDLKKLVAELRTQLDNMGPVNLDAVHEYDELEERYKFLETQNTDLTNSRRELLDVIAQINFTTRKLFNETFEQVRTNFRAMFGELFRGGRADLSLLDENDPLSCGIEITAKPPGKQLQSVSLLSGGERAMTAVALLFAIYMVRPSPFCILDEVDAALDENNINCFIRVLDRFVKQSQFIIITHNKRTIAKGNVLYGVTMEERGVSKLVGVKLTAPAQPIAEAASNGGEQLPNQRRLALAMR